MNPRTLHAALAARQAAKLALAEWVLDHGADLGDALAHVGCLAQAAELRQALMVWYEATNHVLRAERARDALIRSGQLEVGRATP